jgi:DNA-binding NarL/FixJ family response regulator
VNPGGADGFVGREDEVAATLSSILDRGLAGTVVTGEPGCGKTAFAQQVLHRLKNRVRCIPVHGSRALSEVPYGALSPYLGRLATHGDAVAVIRRLTELAHRTDSGSPGHHGLASTSPPALLLVDNAQYLDAASSYVLAHLVMSGTARALVLTRKSGRRAQDLSSLTSDGLLKHLRLPHMTPSDISELCSRTLDGPVARGSSAFIAEAAAGNPMFAQALLTLGLRRNALVQRNGVWVLVDEAPIPDGHIQDLVRSLVIARPAGEQDVLELLALAGELPYSLLSRLAHETDTANMLDEGILGRRSDATQGIFVRSPIFREVLAGVIPYGRSAAMHRRVADDRDWDTGSVPMTARLLEWGLECGRVLPASELLSAARTANNQHRPQSALRFAKAVTDPAVLPAAMVQQARALAGAGRIADSRELLVEVSAGRTPRDVAFEALVVAIQLARRSERPAEELHHAAKFWLSFPGGDDHGNRLDAAAASRQEELAVLISQLAINTGSLSSLPEAESELRRLAELPVAGSDIRAAALALLAERMDASGRSIEALRLAGRAATLLNSAKPVALDGRAFVMTRLMFSLIHAGRYWQVEEYINSFGGGPGDSPSYLKGTSELMVALVCVRQGRLQQGLETLIPAVEELHIADPEMLLPYALGLTALTAARLGERKLALRYAGKFQLLPPQGPQHRWLVAAAYAHAAKAPREDAETAARLADLAAQVRNMGFLRSEKEILEVLCRYPGSDHLDRLGQLAATFEGTEAEAGYLVAAARAAQDPEMLLDAARAAEKALHYLDAAESLAAAAQIYTRIGDLRQSGVMRHRLNLLLHKAGGISSQSLTEAAEGAELTQREHEIVAMAVEGLSNREIAKRLFVSQRTVEGHLYRTFSKLGIRRRKELGLAILSDGQAIYDQRINRDG